MTQKSKTMSLAYILTVTYVLGAGFLGYMIFEQSQVNKHHKSRVANKILNALGDGGRILDIQEWGHELVKANSGVDLESLKDDRDEELRRANNLLSIADKSKARAATYGWFFIGSCVIYFVLMVLLYRGTWMYFQTLALALLSIASLCFVVGIFTPMMELLAFKEDFQIPDKPASVDLLVLKFTFFAEFKGKMFFFYQNKSIMQLIGILFSSGNIVVGVAIAAFSVLVPFLKISLSLYKLFSKKPVGRFADFVITYLGKWSMADVFVVATFLAYLAFVNMKPGVDIQSTVLIGLYFFIAYVILSIGSTYLIKAAHKARKKHFLED